MNFLGFVITAGQIAKLIKYALISLVFAGCGGAGAHQTTGTTTDPAKGDIVDGQPLAIAQSSQSRVVASSVPPADLAGAVSANNAFALDLYERLSAGTTPQNLITSPISASLALTMTYAGALDTTATQMASALHYGSAAGAIFSGQNALSQALGLRGAAALKDDTQTAEADGVSPTSTSDYQLQIVNSVWGEKTYTWNAPFLDILAENYGTGVYQQDFKNSFDQARILINDWVSGATANKINNLLAEGVLDDTARLVLVNAVHLKLPWANTFDASATASASFTTAAGKSVSASFMKRTATMSYVDDGKAQIVGLPLAGGQLALVIALPHGDLSAYAAGLTTSSAGITLPTASALISLSLPKVTFTSPTFSLKTALKAMGMPQAFDPNNANFKGMCTTPPDSEHLYIAEVLQKAMISMQETGVEAAAASAVIMTADSSAQTNPPEPIPMIVNRPYVVSIVDVPTGALLFLGHMVDPTATGGG